MSECSSQKHCESWTTHGTLGIKPTPTPNRHAEESFACLPRTITAGYFGFHGGDLHPKESPLSKRHRITISVLKAYTGRKLTDGEKEMVVGLEKVLNVEGKAQVAAQMEEVLKTMSLAA